MIAFVLTQSSAFFFDRPTLIALAYWVPIGIVLDWLARRWRPIASLDALQRSSNRAWYGILLLAFAVALAWTVFRPSATVVSTGSWIGPVKLLLDYAEIPLPGLTYSRTALVAAGRPDIAAYFGAYLVFCAVLWLVGLVVLGRLAGIASAASERRGKIVAELEKMYPASNTWHTYLWRLGFVFLNWALVVLALIVLWALWHQDVTKSFGMGFFLENAIGGPGAFVPPAMIVLVGVPGVAFAGLTRRAVLQLERLARTKVPEETHLP